MRRATAWALLIGGSFLIEVIFDIDGMGLLGYSAGIKFIVTGMVLLIASIGVTLMVQGLILFLGGVQPSVLLVAVAAFVYSLCTPVIFALSSSIWQTKVEPKIQGRVFAMRRLVAASLSPLAFLAAGPLADYVFEPLLAPGGALAGSLGRLIGVGVGRGIGLLFILLGCSLLVFLAVAASYPRLRNLEREVPDALPDDDE